MEVIQAEAAMGVLLDGDAEYIMSASIIRGVEMLKFLMYAAIPLVVSACTTFGGHREEHRAEVPREAYRRSD